MKKETRGLLNFFIGYFATVFTTVILVTNIASYSKFIIVCILAVDAIEFIFMLVGINTLTQKEELANAV